MSKRVRFDHPQTRTQIVDQLVKELPDTVTRERRDALVRLGLDDIIVARIRALDLDNEKNHPMAIRLLAVLGWYNGLTKDM